MSTYASGSLEVTIPPDSYPLLALAKQSLAPEVLAVLTGKHNLVQDLLENAIGLSVYDIGSYSEGTTLINGSIDGNWERNTDDILRWLAAHGVGIQGEIRNEYDEIWRYDTAPGDQKLSTETLTKTTQQIAAYGEKAEAVIAACADVDLDELPEPLAQALRGLLTVAQNMKT